MMTVLIAEVFVLNDFRLPTVKYYVSNNSTVYVLLIDAYANLLHESNK